MYLFESLELIIKQYLPEEQIEKVRQAYMLARDAHEGVTRSSGEPYITHPVAVACLIANMKLDHEAIMAALLHDVVEDTDYTVEQLTALFGNTVAEIVEGVSKLDKLKFRTRQEAETENFRKMILAMTKDIRVVLIKLADRTHNMRTLGALRPDKRRRIAKETLEIYSPLAHRLGIEHIKNELEDLGFEALHPHRYKVLQRVIHNARGHRKDMIQRIVDEIEQRLDSVGIEARVFGREKHLYSIYQKMKLKEQEFHSIMDIYAFRVIVRDIDTCYRVLGQIHNLYKPRPGRVKDYIAVPKANGYQSLHSSMIGPHGTPVEVQIRTEDMNAMAEMGVAAHWRYKQELSEQVTTAQARAQRWLQSLIELQQSAGNSQEFIESVKSDLFPDEIFVFTPKGRIVELPLGATPIDFAYAVHSDIGQMCVGAKVDRSPYPLSQALENGQTVEIITSPNARPSAGWLNFVVTAKARAKIRQILKNVQKVESIALGKRQLIHALQPYQLEDIAQQNMNLLLSKLNLANKEELFSEIGLGNLISAVIAHQLVGEQVEIDTDGNPNNNQTNQLIIRGGDGLLVSYAQCCHPIPGDPILASVTPGKGLIVHHECCINLKREQQHNAALFTLATWEKSDSYQVEFDAALLLEVENKQGMLATLAVAIAQTGSNIKKITTEEKDSHVHVIKLLISTLNTQQLTLIIKKLSSVSGVIHIERDINE